MTDGEHTATAALKSILERRSSEELLQIWQQNDTSKWGPNAFVVIKSILISRNIELPEQFGSGSSAEVPDVVEEKTSRTRSAVLPAGAIAACAAAVFVFMNSEKLGQRGGFIILLGAIGLGILNL